MKPFDPSNGGPLAGHGSAEPEYVPHDDLDELTRRELDARQWRTIQILIVRLLAALGFLAIITGLCGAVIDHFSK